MKNGYFKFGNFKFGRPAPLKTLLAMLHSGEGFFFLILFFEIKIDLWLKFFKKPSLLSTKRGNKKLISRPVFKKPA